ncbi:hypothetical protein P43SY_007666 [Pythium insidiosum]|uniref:Myb-like domain-containing protein n=1 Tax=Pythium insidiosum TaxID=114742 RepID=A0AAD5LKW4_PYTIN|nr:hypothetical protein P43SY_007666 [Pythium insidiosum]
MSLLVDMKIATGRSLIHQVRANMQDCFYLTVGQKRQLVDASASASPSMPLSDALVRSIRDKIVEYKELLLDQLLEQRVALAAIGPASPLKEDADGQPHGVDAAEDAAAMNGHAPVAAQDEDDDQHQQQQQQQRSEADASAGASLKRPRRNSNSNNKSKSSSSSAAGDAVLPLLSRAVLRSSMPPPQYLSTSTAAARESPAATRAAAEAAALVLRRPASSSGSAAATTAASRSARGGTRGRSLDDLHADLAQSLRRTMRLQRDVQAREQRATRKRQLPRLPAPTPRPVTHWDAVLQEMTWMATDFSQERNWKRVAQSRLASAVVEAQQAERVRRERESRQLAREIAMQVSAFWRTIERVAARSRDRFDATDSNSNHSDRSSINSINNSNSAASPTPTTLEDEELESQTLTLAWRTVQVAAAEKEDVALTAVQQRVQRLVDASQVARRHTLSQREERALASPQGEAALQRALATAPSNAALAAFQIAALRWMLELFFQGFSCLLNDQLGMGKASVVAAFLRVLCELSAESESAPQSQPTGPHLIVVASQELAKWSHCLRRWHPTGVVQIYAGASRQRQALQRAWRRRRDVAPFMASHDVAAALDEEDARPLLCCLCPVDAFMEDRDAFAAFPKWQTLVVDKADGAAFDDLECVAALRRVAARASVRARVVCCSAPLEAWSSSRVRATYAELLLRKQEPTDTDDAWRQAWTQRALLDARSVEAVARRVGSKAMLPKLAAPEQLSALAVALQCLSLRRGRRDVEAQLGKVDEQSVPCGLTPAQQTQYQQAIAAFAAATPKDKDKEADDVGRWLALCLRLRAVCNCVDVTADDDKLAVADVELLERCSGKLQALVELLTRLVRVEDKRVVVYCQQAALLPVVELLLSLLDVPCVGITGSQAAQQAALCHFALRPSVRVALASTRLATPDRRRAAPVYGVDAVVVLDGDWSATCDAKLRAGWARSLAVNPRSDLCVFRVHCEDTIESALLRVGSCLSDKVFGALSPTELLAADPRVRLETPPWWSSSGRDDATVLLARMANAERLERYVHDASALEAALPGELAELDTDEHLLLANADELLPVEWYAVSFVHQLTESKRRVEPEDDDDGMDVDDVDGDHAASPLHSFDAMAAAASRQLWQQADDELFFLADAVDPLQLSLEDDGAVAALAPSGSPAMYDVLAPARSVESVAERQRARDGADSVYRVAYRVPPPPTAVAATPASASAALKSKMDGDKVKSKKQRVAGGRPPSSSLGSSASAASTSGVKRKHSALQSGASKPSSSAASAKELSDHLPSDMAEFEDDDFWGDTNLDALDAAAWDDPAVLSGILGPSLDTSPSGSTAAGASSGPSAGASSSSKKKAKTSASGAAASSSSTPGSSGTRVRKGSLSESGRDGWSAQDDLVLKTLVELYGANWTLVAHVFNSATSVSRFVYRSRSPRQCFERYGKIVSSSGSGSGSGAGSSAGSSATSSTSTPTKDRSDGRQALSLKQQKLTAAAAALWTPEILAHRFGVPREELLVVFASRDSMPGLPHASIGNVPSLVELSLKKRKQPGVGLDDLKSIRVSFDAIMQCMKRKTPPPPIPIPPASLEPTEPPGPAPADDSAASAAPTPAAGSSLVSPAPTVVPAPHKSHLDLIETLPPFALAPDDVIKRSKEAAAAAVQAATAVAGANVSLNPTFAARKTPVSTPSRAVASLHSAALSPPSTHWGEARRAATMVGPAVSTVAASPAAVLPPTTLTMPVQAPAAGVATAAAVPTSTPASVPSTAATSPVQQQQHAAATRAGAMPVTTSALLHMLDRMPEIKHKIQAILNRADCSEAQKVAMIARLLSTTNAINATTVAAAASGNISAAVSATLGSAGAGAVATSVVSTPMYSHAAGSGAPMPDLETPIPMPPSLADDPSPAASTAASVPSPAAAAALGRALAAPDGARLT